MKIAGRKIRVMVLYGGKSGEHEVSLQTAASIIKHLDRTQYEIVPVGIDKIGDWYPQDLSLLDTTVNDNLPLPSPNSLSHPPALNFLPSLHPQLDPIPASSPKNSSAPIEKIDVIFPALHGTFYEDGALQGLLEIANLPYVGANILSSALGMDKALTKTILSQANIPVVPYKVIKARQWHSDSKLQLKEILQQLELPLFVKPANLGSSVATYKVMSAADLEDKINHAFQYTEKVLVEKAIAAREIEFSVLENLDDKQPPLVSGAGEIIPSAQHGFYSYTAKYLDPEGAALIIPAPLTPAQLAEGQRIARLAFDLIDIEGMARVDFLLDKETGELYFNEVNTLPGFTAISMYPKLWEAAGLPYPKLLSSLIDLALKRQERRRHICHDWNNKI